MIIIIIANNEYLTRHNRALMILAVAWAKEYELIGEDTVWYKERWERSTVLENGKAKLRTEPTKDEYVQKT